MNIQDIKNFLENESLIKQLNLDCERPGSHIKNKELLKQIIINSNKLILSNNELFYLIDNINNLQNLHIFCPVCGKKNKFKNKNLGYFYHCSVKCADLDPKNILKRKFNNILKYGTDNYFKSNDFKIKSKLTKKEKYGDENWNNRNKFKETKIKKYGTTSYNNRDKAKQTMLEKYGVSSYTKTKECLEKMQNTCFKRYGVKNAYQKSDVIENMHNFYKDKNNVKRKVALIKQTNKERHGNENYVNVEKAKETNLKKYGKEFYTQTKLYKDKIKSKYDEIRQKVNDTKKKNNTFNSSNQENNIYIKLLTKFPNAIHHYTTDSRYPFECDFYIPSRDLFIELNFHWTHGSEPFDNNNFKHIQILEKWKNKNTRYYTNAIKVWTISDPSKLATFKKNNLNYKIFYTKKEFDSWFNIS